MRPSRRWVPTSDPWSRSRRRPPEPRARGLAGSGLLARALGLEQLNQPASRLPQPRHLPLRDQLAEHLDRRALRTDGLLAERPGDDRVVAKTPHPDALVPFGQQLGDLVEVLVLAAVAIQV